MKQIEIKFANSRASISTARVMERLNIEKADGGAGITIGKVTHQAC